MRRFTMILALVAFAAVSPAAALGKSKASSRPMSGTGSSTTIVDLATGTGSVAGGGQVSQLGKFKFTNDITSFTLTGPDTFGLTLTAIIVAANGDKLCTAATGKGTLTPTGSETSACQQDHRWDRSLRPRPRDAHQQDQQRNRLDRRHNHHDPRLRDSRRTNQVLGATARRRAGKWPDAPAVAEHLALRSG